MEGSLSEGERQRLAALAAATANGLLVLFVLSVALPLIPPKLADPFWLLAFTGAFCTNGFLAVLLLHLSAALKPESLRHQARRLLVRRCSRLVVLGFLLLIPLQGLAAWRGLEAAKSLAYRAGRVQQARLAQFRQAVERSGTIAELQSQLAAMQAASVQRDPWRDAPPDLSTRELEMVVLLVQGLGDREIAEQLKISYETVRSRGKALRHKLGVSSRAQVVAKALQLGLARLGGR